ncbi:uncharacterized protein LOC130612976 [Hydractinia symbiolongicarpus]|uniref:uncharacterized protein LOC130612976 n=1 Tax=Hydractinia symbiolongicarpus TaxID=13093 RepID=UPI002550099A|nr:uncharacterized protein LOC130612976 [Hydractinia symbiolongicarpus]
MAGKKLKNTLFFSEKGTQKHGKIQDRNFCSINCCDFAKLILSFEIANIYEIEHKLFVIKQHERFMHIKKPSHANPTIFSFKNTRTSHTNFHDKLKIIYIKLELASTLVRGILSSGTNLTFISRQSECITHVERFSCFDNNIKCCTDVRQHGVAVLCIIFVQYSIEWLRHRKYLEYNLVREFGKNQLDTNPLDTKAYEQCFYRDYVTKTVYNSYCEFFCRKGRQKCLTKKINIAFLKTHKTASSTVTSILNRFADINNLDIAIPKRDLRFNWPSSFTLAAVDQSRMKKKRANVLCNHSVLNRKELVKAMKSGFRLITILRDPVEQIYSLFHYENFAKIYQIHLAEDPVEHFFMNTSSYYRQSNSKRELEIENLLKNGMTFDLNFQQFKKQEVNNSFQDFVTYIDQAFHLVLITEKFDESLLLLKQLMCWNYMDIVYIKKLVNHKLHKQQKKRKEELVKKIRNWSNLDVILYEHFRKKQENILALQNQDQLHDKLLRFRTLNNLVSRYCRNATPANFYKVIEMLRELREVPPEMFLNKPNCFCNKLERSELDYWVYFKKKINDGC